MDGADVGRQPRGFTLLELLVVLGIVAILVATLMPALAMARERSRTVACQAQLRSIGLALASYRDQNMDRFPLAPALPTADPTLVPLMRQLDPYLDNSNDAVFHCPSDDRTFPVEGTSYLYNIEVGTMPLVDTFFYRIYRSETKVPTVWEADRFHGGELPTNWLYADGHVSGPPS